MLFFLSCMSQPALQQSKLMFDKEEQILSHTVVSDVPFLFEDGIYVMCRRCKEFLAIKMT